MQDNPFKDLHRTPREHFKLCFYSAVLNVIGNLTRSLGSFEEVFKTFPFLTAYSDQIAARGAAGLPVATAADWWHQSLETWENGSDVHLPLRALRIGSHLDRTAFTMFLSVGLVEEESRFGDVFESIQASAGQRRPTYALLNSWLDQSRPDLETTAPLHQLVNLGLLQAVNPSAPRSEWMLQIPSPLWDVLRGNLETPSVSWFNYSPPSASMELQELILSEGLRKDLKEISAALALRKANGLILRGLGRNGRRTAVKAVAKSLSRGVLEVTGLDQASDERWKIVGPLATALNSIPVAVVELPPGQTVELPALSVYDGPTALVLGRQGGVSGRWGEQAITVTLDVPDPAERMSHWLGVAGTQPNNELEVVSERYRMTRGNIRRGAAIASSYSSVNRHTTIQASDVQQALRALNHEVLDGLAERVDTTVDWSNLATAPTTFDELQNLEQRCRHRERLHSAVGHVLGSHLNSGVRALFSGPSGTGKTLAARLLAASLQMDLYRINLATVVNKYIGETEKNLNLVLSRAEELPVMLLLDEGDALLTHRTNVHTSNDRYANLETNFLLQRLESFDGIIIITTNAGDRIDGAFLRRMDVVIDFRPPDPAERWALWTMFLPATHSIEYDVLAEIASRCAMTGGQIRNAMLHASLLALSNGGIITSDYLQAAVRREYRKTGSVCPLRQTNQVSQGPAHTW